jgi:hypothetical protein
MQEFPQHMHAVAKALLGEPNKHHSKGELRYGSHGSLSIDLENGTYYNHETKEGGGVIDLVRHVKGLDKHETLDWLREQGFLDKAVPGISAPRSARKSPPPSASPLHEEKAPEATYDYPDQHGKLVFQVVRYGFRNADGSVVMADDGKPKKTFAQRRKVGSDWLWSVKGIEQVPYRLPELIDPIANDKQIFVVEGEKCVDRLIDAGLSATCNAGGAGKWPNELTPHFAGARVVVLPDSDQPGRDHGALVAEKLKGTAESIVILDLPDLAEKQDVVNWLEAGHTAAELQELVATKGRLPEEAAAQPQQVIRATPFRWREPCSIPPRKFIYGRHLARGYVSTTTAAGGVGKTALKLAETLSLITGRELLGDRVPEPVPTWYWGLEDPLVEYERRVAAVALHYGIPGSAIEAGLFLDSGRDQNFVFATEERSGVKIIEPIVDAIIANMRDRHIGLIVVDPFVASHAVGENDNTRIEKVTREWARIAEVTNCAVELIHHLRKGNGSAELSADDVRGGGAIVNAARSVRILTPMTKEEASEANVDERRRFFKVSFNKPNMFLPPEAFEWRELKTVSLGNGNGGPDDEIQVATRWAWPNAFDGLHVSDLDKVQDRIASGEWAGNVQANNWAGYAIAEVLGLNLAKAADKARVKSLLGTWINSGALKTKPVYDERHSRMKPMIVVGTRA